MDDHTVKTLNESSNEWCIRLVNIISYHVIDGFKSIFEESWKLCRDNREQDKYLMTFQNMISQIPHWNAYTVKEEVKRIVSKSNCNYLEDLITCVHIIQLKLLTCVRVSNNQKKIDIRMPSIEDFIHKVYINIARKLYSNIFLFERQIHPINIQKNNREFELIVNNCILNTIRDNIPIDEILRSYLYERDEIFNVNQNNGGETNKRALPVVANNEKQKLELRNKENEASIEQPKNDISLNMNSMNEANSKIITSEIESKIENDPVLNFDNSGLLRMDDDTSQSEISNIINNNLQNDSIKIVSDITDSNDSATSFVSPTQSVEPVAKRNKLSFNDTITAVDIDGNEESMPLIDLSRMPSTEDFDSFNDYGDTLQILDDVGIETNSSPALEIEEL